MRTAITTITIITNITTITITMKPIAQVPHYLAAQYLGAFAASAAVFLVYWDALVW